MTTLLEAIKKRLASGDVPINPDDSNLHKIALIDPILLLKSLKPYARKRSLVKIALYPHKEGHAVLIRDACESNEYRWTAVSPLVWEE